MAKKKKYAVIMRTYYKDLEMECSDITLVGLIKGKAGLHAMVMDYTVNKVYSESIVKVKKVKDLKPAGKAAVEDICFTTDVEPKDRIYGKHYLVEDGEEMKIFSLYEVEKFHKGVAFTDYNVLGRLYHVHDPAEGVEHDPFGKDD